MSRITHRASLLIAIAAAALLGSALPAPGLTGTSDVAPRARLAADCQPWGRAPCLLPFPNNLFTRPDRTSATGLRVDLPPVSMPANWRGEHMSTAEYDRNDGFSPGSTVIVHVPGLDNPQALQRTGAVGLVDLSQALAPGQPIVIVDERTGERQLVWCELDPAASSAAARNVLIHPASALQEGDTYVVALRDLRGARGRLLAAPRWFELLRENSGLPRRELAQRGRYARIFETLARAGIARRELYEAWDFTVSSAQSLTGRLLAIRDGAFAQLGASDLASGVLAGGAPRFVITEAAPLTPQLRRVRGALEVPCYLLRCGETETAGFHYTSLAPDAPPTQLPGNVAAAPFECILPSAATAAHPARIVLYGHGFLSSDAEVEAQNVQELAADHETALCATDWWGLAKPDTPALLHALADVNLVPAVVDRVQQGILNALYLARLMLDPEGLASNPAFEADGRSVLDTSNLYYYGNSVGGILGGVLTSAAPDFRRAVLGVSGADLFALMLPRGGAFSYFGSFVLHNYPDQSLHPLVFDLLQQLWDRADPVAYGAHMTGAPLPNTPSHVVLLQIAYGDFEVSMYAAAFEARTIGASAYEPALWTSGDRLQDRNLFYGIPSIAAYPFGGSAIELWDSGPGRTQAPPLTALPPTPSASNHDPHEDPRYAPAAQLQISRFLQPDGAVVDVCGGEPCAPPWYEP